ncbi:MAG: succinate dehydrogenase, cytochrome b556 subunit [Pseudomonadota bacterium]
MTVADKTIVPDTKPGKDTRPIAAPPAMSPPLSPHLQIWRFTPTMAASIIQRGTGVANFSGTLLLAIWALSLSNGEAFFAPVSNFLASPFGQFIIIGYVWSLSFHMLGGLRYLYTDTGRGLEPKRATRDAWLTIIGSFVLTALIAVLAIMARNTTGS